MRILLINELKHKGGTEIQTRREFDYFASKGNEMYLLTFDPNEKEITSGKEINIPCKYNLLKRTYHRLFLSRIFLRRLKKIIDEIKPDVIHINNVWRNCLDVMVAVQNYPVVQTIRDYGAVCPKLTCIYDDYSMCMGYGFGDCKRCLRTAELQIKLFSLKRYNKLRNLSVNKFLAPSRALANCCSKNEIPTECVNNPFDFSIINNNRKSFKYPQIFMYYGLIAEIKGVLQLIDAFRNVDTNNVELWFIGEIDKPFKEKFMNEIKEVPYIKYFGKKKNEEIMRLYCDVYCVIVPSLWIENYPNTVLEAIANRTLVIGSNRGGIPELIQCDKLLFDVCSKEDIVKVITYVLNMSEKEYITITSDAFNRIISSNSQEKYYANLVSIYNQIMQTS